MTKELVKVPDTKGTKRAQNSIAQINASIIRDGNAQSATTKKVYLLPSDSDAKIEDFFRYYEQQNSHIYSLRMLEFSVSAKYRAKFGEFWGAKYAQAIFLDACAFTSYFSLDVCSKLEDGITGTDISYYKGDTKVTRYLVHIDNGNVCSIFRHYMDYAISTERPAVKPIIDHSKKISADNRAKNKAAKTINKLHEVADTFGLSFEKALELFQKGLLKI